MGSLLIAPYLKGMSFTYEDDLYEFAEVVLKIMSALDERDGSGRVSRPTIKMALPGIIPWLVEEK